MYFSHLPSICTQHLAPGINILIYFLNAYDANASLKRLKVMSIWTSR